MLFISSQQQRYDIFSAVLYPLKQNKQKEFTFNTAPYVSGNLQNHGTESKRVERRKSEISL